MKTINFKELKKDLSIAKHFLKLSLSISENNIWIIFTAILIKSVTPFLNIILPKFILDELIGGKRIDILIYLILSVVLGNAILMILNGYFDLRLDVESVSLMNSFEAHLGKNIMNMDFESLENPEILDKKEKALYPITVHNAILKMFNNIIILFQTMITLIGLIAIISTLNIVLIALIFFMVAINSFIFKKSQSVMFNFHKEIAPINRQYSYHYNLANDFSLAKDVRIYNMSSYILKKVKSFNNLGMSIFTKMFISMRKYEGLSSLNLQIQMILMYSYMVYKVFIRAISIGEFSMYISAVNSFSTNVTNFISKFIEFRQMCKYLDLYLQFESIGSKTDKGDLGTEDIEEVKIEFKNVWFKYPKSEQYTLKNIYLTVNNGEKLSIVGENGAGKTTFINLLCRLYRPTKGEILINGVNIEKFNFYQYSKLLSVVFQDFKLFSFTIKENIVFDKVYNKERLEMALKKSGIFEKISLLDKGIETSLFKNFEETGIIFSGGESQKLALARAIYKDSNIIILDEPTAALDPYAEYEVFSTFNKLTENKTTIYISHRLSSCRFCDKIAVFHEGELIEYGSHSELEKANGKYSEMWNSQAQYYI